MIQDVLCAKSYHIALYHFYRGKRVNTSISITATLCIVHDGWHEQLLLDGGEQSPVT